MKVGSPLYTIIVLGLLLTSFLATLSVINGQNSSPVLSIVQSGTTKVKTLSPEPISSTFSVDIRIDNTGSISPGINSVSFTLSWNPTVLRCISAADGTCLPDQSNTGDIAPNNNAGNVTFGLKVLDLSNPLDCALSGGSGVMATLTFEILTLGQSNLTLSPSGPNAAYLTYPNANGTSTSVTNAQTINALYGQAYTSINVYQIGKSNSTVEFPPGTNPLANSFTVDINMSNMAAEPIWGWNIGVNWNPNVIQLETVTQGDYLTNIGGYYDGSPTIFIAGPIDNTADPLPVDNIHGTIKQGISDIYLSNTTTTKTSGSLCILTFNVISYGNSYINVTAGDPTLIDNFGNSLPVVTPNPNTPNFPIISYLWGVQGQLGFQIPSSGSSITFITPNQAISFRVTLTVTTASNQADPNYIDTNSTSMEFDPASQQLTSAGAQIDLYIVNTNPANSTYPLKFPTSQGIYNNTSPTGSYVDTFAPQEQLNLQTFILFNGAPVPNTLVTFVITPQSNPSAIFATFVSYSNGQGYASASYRLPRYNDTSMPFGNYTVTAFVDIAQVRVSDCFSFQYNYILTIFSVTQPANVVAGQRTSFTVNVQCNSFIQQNYYLSWTVTDSNDVPIISSETYGFAFPSGANIQSVTLTIPTYAQNRTALVHFNLFNGNPQIPSQNALPYCNEVDQSFNILP
jgi:hypothetical protein